MQTIQLYNFNRPDGGMTVTPVRPSEAGFRTDYVRLVADDGKIITDGEIVTCCVDVHTDDAGRWTELAEEPIAEDEALVRYANELTGANDQTLEEATETLIKIVKED